MTDSPAPSRTERRALADLLAEVGPDAPTCCEGWQARDLAAHVVVRDRRPDAAAGFVVGGPVGAWTDRVMAGVRQRDFAALVADVRSGPPAWVPTAWPVVDRLLNSVEMTIHHEDVRRAQPGWSPRELDRGAQDQLWSAVPLLARANATGTEGGLVARRTDLPGGTSVRRLRSGAPVTTVAGPPLEVLLWVSGRQDVARVEVTGG